MLVSRSDLRKLRNKVYVRIFSSQNIQKHLLKYQNLTQEFIKRFESQLTWTEVCSLRRRVEVTVNAAAKASMNTICDHLNDENIQRLRLEGQTQSPSILCTFKESKSLSMLGRVLDPIFTTPTFSQGMYTKVPLAEVGVKHIFQTASFREDSDQETEKGMPMDRISEAMAIIMDSASNNENHGMINSFIRETQAVMTVSRDIISEDIMFTNKGISSSETVDIVKSVILSQSVLVSKPEEESLPLVEPDPVPVNVTPWKTKGIMFAKLF